MILFRIRTLFLKKTHTVTRDFRVRFRARMFSSSSRRGNWINTSPKKLKIRIFFISYKYKDKNNLQMKCEKCSKKIKNSIINVNQCKCEKHYCTECLPYFNHNCSFDYKKTKKEILKVENEPVIAQKIVQI